MIWHNWAQKGPNMGMTVPRAPVGGWGTGRPQMFGHGFSFVVQLLDLDNAGITNALYSLMPPLMGF